jgi:ADP-heptose:LPS heptosyltransferase
VPDHEHLRKQYFEDRRQWKEHFFRPLPWYRRVGRVLEQYNKRVSVLLLRKLLRTRNPEPPLSLDSIDRVLIMRYDAIGDMVVTSPIWRILKRLKPSIKIGVAGSYRNLEVIKADPDVDVRYDLSETSLQQMIKGAGVARKDQWQVVLSCVYNRKTKGAIASRLAAPGGLTSTVVYDRVDHYKNLFSIVAHYPHEEKPIQMLDLLRRHLESVFGLTTTDHEWHPSIVIDPQTERETKVAIDKTLASVGAERYIVLNTEAATTFREWGLENALELSNRITNHYPDVAVLWTSSPNSRERVEAFIRDAQPSNRTQLFPTESLHALFTLVRYSSLVLSPDTSVVHIAGAERRPTIGFYVQYNEWQPYRVPNRVYFPPVGNPVTSIAVDDVFRGLQELMHESAP